MRPMFDSPGDEFVLEISGAGEAIALEPVGLIDLRGAQALLDVVDTLSHDRHGTHLEIRLDRVTGVTSEARRVLAEGGITVETPLGVG
jgi:hypothetical protein